MKKTYLTDWVINPSQLQLFLDEQTRPFEIVGFTAESGYSGESSSNGGVWIIIKFLD